MKKELKQEQREPERWKLIDGTEGKYSISDYGRFLSHGRNIIMKTPLAGAGYPSILIKIHGLLKRIYVHRTVGQYFISNPFNFSQINHLFGDKMDNYFKHLEWCSAQRNIHHAFETGLNKYVIKNEPIRSRALFQIDEFGYTIASFPSTMEVQRTLGFRAPNINNAIKFNKKSHGYFWKYQTN